MKYFIYTIISIVAIAVIAGFFVVGSPQSERLRKRDEIRISNLQFIQGEIVNYWLAKETLPSDLAALKDDIRGIVVPTDPNGQEYGYEVKDLANLKFILCADFESASAYDSTESTTRRAKETPMPVGDPYYYGQQNWEHGVGRQCFERPIDKDFYRPLKD